jgi:hypothetical protein
VQLIAPYPCLQSFGGINGGAESGKALSNGGISITYMTINKLSIMTKILTTDSASLSDNIVVINENKGDDSLTTRQGATFDDDTRALLPHSASAALATVS